MQRLYNTLKSNPVIYVTRDIERALGIDPDTEGYFIISNNSEFAKQVAKGKDNILLMTGGKILSTAELLNNDSAKNFINKIKNASVLVFKNTKQVESICSQNKWKILNPPAEISNKIEEKISQVKIFSSLNDLFLNYTIYKCRDIKWTGKKFILQFNYGHTGSGTLLIDSEEKLNGIKEKFAERDARISDFVEGPLFTSNNVLSGNDLIIGNVSYQITGLKYFADRAYSTVGNDWGLAQKLLTPTSLEYFKLIAKSTADELKKLNWKGLFGVDVILDKNSKKMYLIEVNARQPASTTFESKLQKKAEKNGINIFEAHLAGLLDINLSMEKLTPITNGSQLIKRVVRDEDLSIKLVNIISNLKRNNLEVIRYNNKNIGSELLRIQSRESIMKNHNELSPVGKRILSIICPDIQTLSVTAQSVLDSYLNLKVGANHISVPYFNNTRLKTRGGLRVFTGKGSVKEINEEISILSKKKRVNLEKLNNDQAKHFLVDNNIGIDCSGFAYYLLDAQLKDKMDTSLRSVIKFPTKHNIFRKIIAKLRIVQNIDVLTLSQEENSFSIKMKDISPGDFIVLIKSGQKNNLNHIMVITDISHKCKKIDLENTADLTGMVITYAHSFAWSKDGKYNHGVRVGEIEIINPDAGLLDQKWTEQDKTGEDNETYTRASQAKVLDIRRLNVLDK